MNCPRCKQAITHACPQCAFCGHVFGGEDREKLSIFFEMKNELRNVSTIEGNLRAKVERLIQKIDRYEKIVENDLMLSVDPLEGGMPMASEEEAAPPPPLETPVPPAQPQPVPPPAQPQPVPPPARPQSVPPSAASRPSAPQQAPSSAFSARKTAFEAPPSSARQAGGAPPPFPPPRPESYAAGPAEAPPSFELILGQKWMLIVGIITLVFGVGYFLKYSFDQNWIGPAGQVALAYLLGFALLGVGNVFHKNREFEIFGLYLIGGAIAVFYFAAFAGFALYDPKVIEQPVSFLLMIVVTAFACFMAIMFDTKWLAVLGLIGGFLTPVLLSTGVDNVIGLMSYMTLLNAGVLAIAYYKRWNLLNTLGFICTYMLYMGWHASHYVDSETLSKFWPAVIFLNIFFSIYCVVPFAYHFFKEGDPNPVKGFTIITLNAFVAFAYNFFMIREHFGLPWVSVVTVVYAAVFLAMGSYLFGKGKQYQDSFVVVLGEACLFLIITVPIIFSEHWITVFWAAQALALFWMGSKLGRASVCFASYVLMGLTLCKFVFYDYATVFAFSNYCFAFMKGGASDYTFRIVERYVTTVFTLGLVYAFATLGRRTSFRLLMADSDDSGVFYVLFAITLFVSLNIETAAFFYDFAREARFAMISVLWAIFSIGLMVVGFGRKIYLARKTAIGLFLLTVIKVFFYDIAEMKTFGRIISFMCLGVILILASFLYHKFKDRILQAIGKEEDR